MPASVLSLGTRRELFIDGLLIDQFVLHGGVNAVLWDQPDAIRAEMERVLPQVKEAGGYIFSSDHSVPSSVSRDEFASIVELARNLESYA